MKKIILSLLSLIITISISGVVLAANYSSSPAKFSKQLILSEDEPAPAPPAEPAPAPEPTPPPEPN